MGEKDTGVLIKRIKGFKEKIAEKFGVERIVVFGSAARGEMGRDSDVDLLIVSRKFGIKDFFDVVPRLYTEWDLGYPVDFIVYNTREFNRLRKEVSIVSEALREGVEI